MAFRLFRPNDAPAPVGLSVRDILTLYLRHAAVEGIRCDEARIERACRFLRLTGCRLSELCRAEWPDMDLERGIWVIHRHKSRMKKRGQVSTAASMHGIRHRAAGAAIAAGAPLKLVSQQLGHSTTVITERYYCDLTNEIDAIRDAMAKGTPK